MSEIIDANPATDDMYLKFRTINKHLIESLVQPSLWFAKPDTLNDPFDCQLDLYKLLVRAASSATGKRKDLLQSIINDPTFLKRFDVLMGDVGVCSFSRDLATLSTSVLWSHYADKHRGVCLLYRFPESFFYDRNNQIIGTDKVIYKDNMLTNWLKNDAPIESDLDSFAYKLIPNYLTAKNPEWEYEKEMRIIRNEHGLLHISSNFLAQVCFGLNTPSADIELVQKLAREHCSCEKFCRIIRDEENDFGIRVEEM